MILVLGSQGQLGTAFRTILGPEEVYLDVAEMDLSKLDTIHDRVAGYRPEMIVNCAAYTAVDRAESEPEMARSLNTDAVRELARVAGDLDAKLVTFSTDYVFDGTATRPYVESDETNPINVYGKTKREGEMAALDENPEVLVVRTSWLLSGTHANFASTMLRLAATGGGRIVDDQRGHPTLVDDLAPAALEAAGQGSTGIIHMTNQGPTTWFELAREIAAMGGFDPAVFQPCTTEDYPTPAPRPSNSVLASERLGVLGLGEMPHYRGGLARAVESLIERGVV